MKRDVKADRTTPAYLKRLSQSNYVQAPSSAPRFRHGFAALAKLCPHQTPPKVQLALRQFRNFEKAKEKKTPPAELEERKAAKGRLVGSGNPLVNRDLEMEKI